MGFLDQFNKVATQTADALQQGIDRARFEADKFQRTSRIQGEVNEIQSRLDQKLRDLGKRAYDLYRANSITAESFTDLVRDVDDLRIQLTRKEDELRIAQRDEYLQAQSAPSADQAQSVPIHEEAQASASPAAAAAPSAAEPQPASPPAAAAAPSAAEPQPASPPVSPPDAADVAPGRTVHMEAPPTTQAAPADDSSAPEGDTKACPACGFQMPARAVFCPNCGFRVGTTS